MEEDKNATRPLRPMLKLHLHFASPFLLFLVGTVPSLAYKLPPSLWATGDEDRLGLQFFNTIY